VFAERERPYVVVAESDSGAAIIPAAIRKNAVSLLGEELFDYRDVIAAGDAALTETAWEKISALGLPLEVKAVRGERSWGEMRPFAGAPYRSCAVPLEKHYKLERNLRLLAKCGCVLRSQGLKPPSLLGTHHPAEAGCPREDTTAHAFCEEQRSGVDEIGILRSAQDGKSSGHRAIGSSGDQMQIPRRCAPRNDKPKTSDVVRRMYELKGQRENGSLFQDPLRIEAVVQMAATAPTELFTIESDGALIAAILTFIDGDVCRFYGTYYDERWARYSPGTSLLYRVIQQMQSRGLDFDFMTGEQPYKMRFASEVVPLYVASVTVAEKIAA
jgi:hypothetical protein